MTSPPRTILHVDMDAFFVSVEIQHDPSLLGKPVIVGGDGRRGVVAAASYEARAYGVHSAMPSVRARRLCPQAIFVPGRHDRYGEVSERVMEIFRSYTPLVEPLSLDEAFLDVTGARRLHGDGLTIAREIRQRVEAQEGCTCSVGVSAIKFVAKLASVHAKPKASPTGPVEGPGVTVVAPGQELDFLRPHPVRALWGIGKATEPKLERLGVQTIGDLEQLPEKLLIRHLGEAAGRHLFELSHAIDERQVVARSEPKSISHEETFSRDKHSHDALAREVVRLADSVAHRARTSGYTGRTVTLKLRFSEDFRTVSRSITVERPIDTGTELARHGKALLADLDPSPGVRLLGIGLTGLSREAPVQLSLDDGDQQAWSDVADAMEDIRSRFGRDAVVPATLADRNGVRTKKQGDQQWGPDDGSESP